MALPLLWIAGIVSAVITGGVVLYSMKDFLVGFVREVIAPAVRRIALAVADILSAVIDLIENGVTYTTRAARQSVQQFKDKVLGIVSNYQKISYNEAQVTTETYIMDGRQLRKASTNQRLGKNEIPSHVWEKLEKRGYVEMHHEEDILTEVEQKVKL